MKEWALWPKFCGATDSPNLVALFFWCRSGPKNAGMLIAYGKDGESSKPWEDRMTLKNSLLIAFAAITLSSLNAGAYIVGGPIQPGQPFNPGIPGGGTDFPGGPTRPDRPLPPDDFGNGGRFPGYGRQEQKIIYLSRTVVNETLHLRQLAGIGPNYDGYIVESVVVDLRSNDGEIALIADGRELDRSNWTNRVILYPPFRTQLGVDIRTLQLSVRGFADIESITVNLRESDVIGRPDRPGRPGGPSPGMDVPVYVSRRMYGNDRLDLNQYVDLRAYRGHRIEEIIIDATPVYNNALLDLVINGFNQGPSMQIDRYNRSVNIRPYNAVLGLGADSIVFYTRGDLDIRGITLRLSRY